MTDYEKAALVVQVLQGLHITEGTQLEQFNAEAAHNVSFDEWLINKAVNQAKQIFKAIK